MENTQEVKNSWSEVKIRKLDENTCNNISFLLENYKEVSASVAVRKLINNYPRMESDKETANQRIRALNSKVNELERALAEANAKINNIKSAYQSFVEIIQ